MKLKLLRQHYQTTDKRNWTPKESFTTKNEVVQKLGFDLNSFSIYTCEVCGKFHISNPRKYKS